MEMMRDGEAWLTQLDKEVIHASLIENALSMEVFGMAFE